MRRKLQLLTNIEQSSRILLGALYRQIETSPFNYVYSALDVQIKLMETNSERELISKYIK